MVMGTDTHTASLYELAFTAKRSVSGQCCEVKQRRTRLVAGWVVVALMLGTISTTVLKRGDVVVYGCKVARSARQTRNSSRVAASVTLVGRS